MRRTINRAQSQVLVHQQGLLLNTVRTWFHRHGYVEVYTPCTVESPALEENIEAFPIGKEWLHTSPEFSMKKIIASGLCRIYQIAPCFRDDETGPHHSSEFRMLEWYRVGASSFDIMHECISLVGNCYEVLNKQCPEFVQIQTQDYLPLELSPEEWWFRWVDEIEPILPTACVVLGYPAWQAALAKTNGQVADRFEMYINGIEIANAFHEETDSSVIKERWQTANSDRVNRNKTPYPIDNEFLQLNDLMPKTSGIALGLERLFMVLLELENIHVLQHAWQRR